MAPASGTTPLHDLAALGQSVWIDELSRETLRDGTLAAMIERDAVVGVTSNPTIFERALASGDACDDQLRELRDAGMRDSDIAFWALAQRDVQEACDLLAPVWEHSGARDGWVSLEVDPALAHDTRATVRAARRLHAEIARPNLMVKIPATKPGLAAIEDAVATGIPVNVTLIFSLRRYAEVAESYIRGIRRLVAGGGDPTRVASVASFFISRIDTETDRRLDALATHPHLRGQLAIANAKLAYRHFQATYDGPRWESLAAEGATPQRVLWASTSAKDPAYTDTRYVEQLAGPDTVNTMPPATLRAFADHGVARPLLTTGLPEAEAVLIRLADAGIDYEDVTATLERDGIEQFAASFRNLVVGLERRLAASP